ncbi:unnamed protein product, partial [Staurois parvus]
MWSNQSVNCVLCAVCNCVAVCVCFTVSKLLCTAMQTSVQELTGERTVLFTNMHPLPGNAKS